MKLIIPDNNDPKLIGAVKRLIKKNLIIKLLTQIYGKPTESKYYAARKGFGKHGGDNQRI